MLAPSGYLINNSRAINSRGAGTHCYVLAHGNEKKPIFYLFGFESPPCSLRPRACAWSGIDKFQMFAIELHYLEGLRLEAFAIDLIRPEDGTGSSLEGTEAPLSL